MHNFIQKIISFLSIFRRVIKQILILFYLYSIFFPEIIIAIHIIRKVYTI